MAKAQAGAVSGRPGAAGVNAVFSVVVLRAGSLSRQVTSVAVVRSPLRVARPPAVMAVADEPGGSSCRTVVSTGRLPSLRTRIR
ncbi:hypothetical protein JNW88_23660 [Micromonospora sp. ATA32]|nr:hypothetical protein [Micromonospora sp. ATA32]